MKLKHFFWAPLKCLKIHLILSNKNVLSIQKPNNTSPKYKFLDNKLADFKGLIRNETEAFLISESKLDNTIPNAQFQAEGYRLIRKDRNKFRRGIILLVKENIPRKIINSHKFPVSIKMIKLFASNSAFVIKNDFFLGDRSPDYFFLN